MAVIGVVCEYNPFHLGHRIMLQQVKTGEGDIVVCAMSGNFVQRGEPALLPKLYRAEMAVRQGADLILELPTPWAMATAEVFAKGAVSLLKMADCDRIAFGSESGDVQLLKRTAEILSEKETDLQVRKGLEQGMTYAAAREQAVQSVSEKCAELLRCPNDILAVEYLRAAGTELLPIAVKRIGSAHDAEPEGEIASASYIREKLLQKENADAEKYLTEDSIKILHRAMENGMAPCCSEQMEKALLFQLRQMTEEELLLYDDGNEGLYHRLYRAIQKETTLHAILEETKTKRYTMARIRRMVMSAALEIHEIPAEIPYLRVLAASEKGRTQLKRLRMEGKPVLTKAADVDRLGAEAEHLMRQESRCTDLYALAMPQNIPCGSDYRLTPIMV